MSSAEFSPEQPDFSLEEQFVMLQNAERVVDNVCTSYAEELGAAALDRTMRDIEYYDGIRDMIIGDYVKPAIGRLGDEANLEADAKTFPDIVERKLARLTEMDKIPDTAVEFSRRANYVSRYYNDGPSDYSGVPDGMEKPLSIEEQLANVESVRIIDLPFNNLHQKSNGRSDLSGQGWDEYKKQLDKKISDHKSKDNPNDPNNPVNE